MTPAEKEAAKAALLDKYQQHQIDTFRYLFRSTEEQRKHSGYSKGPEDMIQRLVKTYQDESMKMMKPFDRGDFD